MDRAYGPIRRTQGRSKRNKIETLRESQAERRKPETIVRLFSMGYQQAVEAAIQDGEKSAGETGEEVEQGGSFQGTKARVCDGSLTNLITLTRKCIGQQ